MNPMVEMGNMRALVHNSITKHAPSWSQEMGDWNWDRTVEDIAKVTGKSYAEDAEYSEKVDRAIFEYTDFAECYMSRRIKSGS